MSFYYLINLDLIASKSPPMSPSTVQSPRSLVHAPFPPPVPEQPEVDPDDPSLTIPLVRYNAMLAVLKNTLYM